MKIVEIEIGLSDGCRLVMMVDLNKLGGQISMVDDGRTSVMSLKNHETGEAIVLNWNRVLYIKQFVGDDSDG